MSSLLEVVIAAHGGMDRWREVRTVTTGVRSWGLTWARKGQQFLFSGVTAEAATTRQAVQVDPFTGEGRRGLYTPDRVRIESADGTILEDRQRPREAFTGHTLESPWDHLHGLYFGGYALWNYFNLPFLAARLDVDAQEIDPWDEAPGKKWRRLRLAFPPHIATHSSVQDLYVDDNGLIVRHDYAPEVIASAPSSNYLYDYSEYDGIMFPSLRKVVRRSTDNRTGPQSDDDKLLIGIEFSEYTLA